MLFLGNVSEWLQMFCRTIWSIQYGITYANNPKGPWVYFTQQDYGSILGLVTGDPNEIPLEDDEDDSQDMLDDVNGLEESGGLEFNDPNEIVLEDEDNEQYHST